MLLEEDGGVVFILSGAQPGLWNFHLMSSTQVVINKNNQHEKGRKWCAAGVLTWLAIM